MVVSYGAQQDPSMLDDHETIAREQPAAAGACCGDGCAAASIVPRAPAAASAPSRTFDIAGLDCAEEVRILERAVGPVVGGRERLAFDVLNGRMSVLETDGDVTDAAIAASVGATGLRATRVGASGAARPSGPSRAAMTAASGCALVLGILVHVLHVQAADGPVTWGALIGAHEHAPMPVLESLAWLAATGFGVRHVLPKAWYALRGTR